jgi:hypothetical protein
MFEAEEAPQVGREAKGDERASVDSVRVESICFRNVKRENIVELQINSHDRRENGCRKLLEKRQFH